jgi:hypothetical protein
VCLNINPNLPIQDTLIPLIMFNYNINIDYNNLRFKLISNGINNLVEWFDKYFDNNLHPLIDEFFINQNISIIKSDDNKECIICYENKDKIITLNCHSTHTVCMDCIKIWYSTNTSCPMCRNNINFHQCSISCK